MGLESPTWAEIWERRELDRSRSTLAALMAADGLDTGFGSVSEESWRAFVLRVADRLGLRAGTSVYEVGCGAGAFLWELHRAGCRVGGLDLSARLVAYAREVMPEAPFAQGEAAAISTDDLWDVVLSCGVFMYFPDHAYAGRVLDRMAAKARRAMAILDVPDRATQAAALAHRRGTLGEAEYEARYKSLPHLYYDRAWLADSLRSRGFSRVEVESQRVDGYANAAFRFNVFAER